MPTCPLVVLVLPVVVVEMDTDMDMVDMVVTLEGGLSDMDESYSITTNSSTSKLKLSLST